MLAIQAWMCCVLHGLQCVTVWGMECGWVVLCVRGQPAGHVVQSVAGCCVCMDSLLDMWCRVWLCATWSYSVLWLFTVWLCGTVSVSACSV